MKTFNYVVLIAFFVLALFSCSHEHAEEEIQVSADSLTIEHQEVLEIKIAEDLERDSIQKELSFKSYFLELGCCDIEAKRTEDCCCNAVLEEYKNLVESGDSKLGEYNMSDPILGKCKKLMANEFDLVDNPPIQEEEDEYGGGF